jgi:hypothetical protein
VKCFYHTDTDAVGTCSQCGKTACRACIEDIRGVLLCKGCMALKLEARELRKEATEGSDALVEVSITNAPTPLYDKITEAARPLFAQCGPFPDPKPYFCGRWPSRDALTVPEKFTYHFSRYDDGWRLVTE